MTSLFPSILIFLCVLNWNLKASDYDIPPSIRFTLDREPGSPPITYYLNQPDPIDTPYPILIICDGSVSKGDLYSVFWMRQFLASKVEPLNIGCLTVEKWGINGNEINEEELWQHYTRSQRLEDHLRVIHHLQEHPPKGWNKKLLLLGASEGGPLVTDLSILCPNVIATINWCGAGDWPWADEMWLFFEHLKQDPFWIKNQPPLGSMDTPFPETRSEFDALVDFIKTHPIVDQRMGGMPYLYLADAFHRASIDYGKIHAPFLVVAGTEDSIITSCDEFVRKAQEARAPVTYFRVDGMDHYIRKRPDIIDQSFEWLKEQLSPEAK